MCKVEKRSSEGVNSGRGKLEGNSPRIISRDIDKLISRLREGPAY